MPAGLSQITQSNFSCSSPITRATPSSVKASLSRRLRRWKDGERVEPLVADECLGELRVALHHVDEIKDDPPFGPHNQIKVAQTDIEIHNDDILPIVSKGGAECGSRGGFSDPAFPGRNNHDRSHMEPLRWLEKTNAETEFFLVNERLMPLAAGTVALKVKE